MNIAVFTNTYLPHVGGVANSVDTLVTGMRQRGHAVLVVAPDFPDQPQSETDVVRVPSIQNFNGTDFSYRLPSGNLIRDAIKAFQPDLVHTHHPFLLGDAGMRMAHEWTVPLVFTHHTRYENYVHYVLEESDWLERLAVELATEYANLCDRVIAPSESIANLIRERGVEKPLTVIPTGIDAERFAKGDRVNGRRRFGIPEDRFVVGHVGRVAEEKNLHFLARAVGRYLKQADDAVFLLVGSGDALDEIKAHFQDEGLQDRVYYGGKLKGQDLVDAYHAMDLFAFSSKSETQGMVLAEAMASGIPVIALDASGARDIIDDGINGRLIPENASETDFADGISRLRGQAETDSKALQESLKQTAQAFSTTNCLDRLEETYRELLKTESAGRDVPAWTRFTNRIEAEWDLAVGRARAVGAAFKKV